MSDEFYEEDEQYDEDEDDEGYVWVNQETGEVYDEQQLAGAAEAIHRQTKAQFWDQAGQRFEKVLGRKPAAKEMQAINERLPHHWNGVEDPAESIRQSFDAYLAEETGGKDPYDQDTSSGRSDYMNQRFRDAEKAGGQE